MKPSRRSCHVLLLLALGSAAPAAAAPERRFSVAPAGKWVDEAAPPEATLEDAAESTGIRELLFDQQIRVGPREREDYYRTVWKAETTAGLQDASEIEISFDPSFQRLTIHHVRVEREGRTVWSFSPGDVRVIQAEPDVDERLYNGDLTAVVFPRQLRVGDTVDYAYTLTGANPVLAGRFDTLLRLGYSFPVDVVKRRILWQRATPLQLRMRSGAPEPVVATRPDGTDYRWELRGAEPPAVDDRAPSWFDAYARVEASEFRDWNEVAARFRELFASLDAKAPRLDNLVRQWRLPEASEDARVDRAVRFVQDDVRYLGIEIGPNSHQPHAPSETLERRFGDCKDKAALLVAVLRRLGVSAWPALVATRTREALDDRLPSLFAFDHAIVAIRLGGALHFVDATASQQGGHVRDREPPPYARALVLEEAASGLTKVALAAAPVPSTDVEETFAQTAWGAPTRFDVVSTYRGRHADSMRQSQARTTRAAAGKRYRDFYAQEHAEIRELHPPKVEDDREANVLVVREAYEIPALFQQGRHDFRAWFIDEQLVRPKKLERSAPFAVSYPDHVRHTLTIRLPGPPDVEPLRRTVKDGAFSLEAARSVRGNEAKLVYTYRSLSPSVSSKEVSGHVAMLDHASDLLSCEVGVRAAGTAVAAPVNDPAGAWLTLGVLGCGFVALVVWGAGRSATALHNRRRRARFEASAASQPGEQARNAFVVATLDAVPREGDAGACGCGGPWREIFRMSLAYDRRPMTVVTRRCERCFGERTLYFTTAPAQPPA